MTTIYGIKNCDTIKKTKKWFDQNNISYDFHDYRVDGIESEWLENVLENVGADVVVNKRGTTYRKLDDAEKQKIDNGDVLNSLLQNPAMIKRPIVIKGDSIVVGFNADKFAQHFQE